MEEINFTVLQQSVIKTLLYYDIFNYPLKSEEVHRFMGGKEVSLKEVTQTLLFLTQRQCTFRFGDLFSIHNDPENAVRRINGNKLAEKHLPLVKRRAALLAAFPFVKAVLASGSFSKGYMDAKSDLDFFIITTPGRLWIARTMIVMFKRLFFFNSHKYFCCNYFIDADHLEIEEKNLFTATELATLLPLYNTSLYQQLMDKNRWILKFFPNYKRQVDTSINNKKPAIIKRFLEMILRASVWNSIESFFMSMTLKRWKRIYEKDYAIADFNVVFKTRKYVSKNHPNHFQRKVLTRLEEKLTSFYSKHNVPSEKVM